MSDGQAPQRYSANERIVIGIKLHDDSGIHDVTGLFVHSENPNAAITMPGYGGGAQRATVYIQNFVTTNTPPGQYICKHVQAQDGRGNLSTLHPDITFYVDQQPVPDDQGPELKGWYFPSEEVRVVERSLIEIEAAKRDARQYAELQPTETAKGTSEDTGAHGNMQEGTMDASEGDALQLIGGKMDEMAQEMTEDTGGHGDIRLHAQRRMDETAREMFEED